MIRKFFSVLLMVLFVLMAIVLFRTWKYGRKLVSGTALAIPPLSDSAIRHLSEAVRIRTISWADSLPVNTAEFLRFRSFLQDAYPLVNRYLSRKTFCDFSYLYTWEGRNKLLRPYVLMAHSDVVPVERGTEHDWTLPPFSGALRDGMIWGRGVVDDKGCLVPILEAVEGLLRDHFQPERTIYLSFGHDEELSGLHGASRIASWFREQDIHPELVLDEGGEISREEFPSVPRPVAMIGIAEKGYLSFTLTVEKPGGHSSIPPKETAVDILCAALVRLRSSQMPFHMTAPMDALLDKMGPSLPFTRRMALANRWLLPFLVRKEFDRSLASHALFHTTIVPTLLQSGIKDNIIPSRAMAVVNCRNLPGEPAADVLGFMKKQIGDERVIITAEKTNKDASPVTPVDGPAFRKVEALCYKIMPDVLPVPFLLTGGTDSYFFSQVSDGVIKFAPSIDGKGFHGVNERLPVSDLQRMVFFYILLIRDAAGLGSPAISGRVMGFVSLRMHYISAEGLTKTYGTKTLFDKISFHIESGDKIGLVARNGSGKSTLLRILSGREGPDEGRLWVRKEIKLAFFEQEPSFSEDASILDNIFRHDHPLIQAVKAYEAAAESGDTQKLGAAVTRMDQLEGWNFESRVKQILGKLGLHQLQEPVSSISGGQKKRVALARTLIDIGSDNEGSILLLDEPTNHLDLDAIEWLEQYLNQEKLTLLLVTHDRYFLDAVCREIWEMDRDRIHVYRGDYAHFLEKKAERIEQQAAHIEKARNTYRKELEWMRRQPRARTTKSRSREENFYEIQTRAKQKLDDPQILLQIKMNRLGGKIAELKKLNKSFPGKVILRAFDYNFKKGERVGLVGPNGAGKTTLVRLLLGLEKPDSGKVNIGETVVFGHYSQQGLEFSEDMRVIEWVKRIAEYFPLASGGSLNASQFLNLFLFAPEQQYSYLSSLSGGEKRRLHLLSVLYLNPNFMILDEPTNDLDLPTLAILENFLAEYPGCLLLISHDRYFMDRLVDHVLVMEGNGVMRDFPGNYSQYRESLREENLLLPEAQEVQSSPAEFSAGTQRPVRRNQLSFKEKREFEQLEKEIADLESEKNAIQETLNQGGTGFEELDKLSRRIVDIGNLLDLKEMRWLELSEAENG